MGRLSKILSMVSANQALLVSPLAFGDQVVFSLAELSLWDTQRSQTDNSCSLFCQFLGLVPEEQAHRAHVKVETEVSTLLRDNFLCLMQHHETNSTCSHLTAQEQNRSLTEIISVLLGVKCWCITPDAILLENLSLSNTLHYRSTQSMWFLAHTTLKKSNFYKSDHWTKLSYEGSLFLKKAQA